jgi:CheY-like chemotaxis protein
MVTASADEGLEFLKSFHPDVLLSDIGMPNKDGYQFIHDVCLMSAGEGGSIPAVALTAFVRTEERRRAMLAGYHSDVAKPIEPGKPTVVVAMQAGRTSTNPAKDRFA